VAPGAGLNIGKNTLDLRASLWALAHIAATEYGINAIQNVDPAFVDWCVEGACTSPFFSLRATFFYVVGLVSRTATGGHRLNRLRWDFAVHGSNSAVALPRNPAVLFRKMVSSTTSTTSGSVGNNNSSSSSSSNGYNVKKEVVHRLPPSGAATNKPPTIDLVPFTTPLTVGAEGGRDQEVLNIICKVRCCALKCISWVASNGLAVCGWLVVVGDLSCRCRVSFCTASAKCGWKPSRKRTLSSLVAAVSFWR
jgi:hypothetical protein